MSGVTGSAGCDRADLDPRLTAPNADSSAGPPVVRPGPTAGRRSRSAACRSGPTALTPRCRAGAGPPVPRRRAGRAGRRSRPRPARPSAGTRSARSANRSATSVPSACTARRRGCRPATAGTTGSTLDRRPSDVASPSRRGRPPTVPAKVTTPSTGRDHLGAGCRSQVDPAMPGGPRAAAVRSNGARDVGRARERQTVGPGRWRGAGRTGRSEPIRRRRRIRLSSTTTVPSAAARRTVRVPRVMP